MTRAPFRGIDGVQDPTAHPGMRRTFRDSPARRGGVRHIQLRQPQPRVALPHVSARYPEFHRSPIPDRGPHSALVKHPSDSPITAQPGALRAHRRARDRQERSGRRVRLAAHRGGVWWVSRDGTRTDPDSLAATFAGGASRGSGVPCGPAVSTGSGPCRESIRAGSADRRRTGRAMGKPPEVRAERLPRWEVRGRRSAWVTPADALRSRVRVPPRSR
jgi:hypothetical protein